MNPCLYPLAILMAGLSAAQILFGILVFSSNLSLHAMLSALNAEGFVIVPNANVLPSLLEWAPAFYGGLFFTLTIGAGLSVCALLTVSLWRGVFQKNFGLWGVFAGAVIFLWMRFDGHPWMTLASGATLLGAGLPAVKLFPKDAAPARKIPSLKAVFAAHLAAFILICMIWAPRLHEGAFVSIRDDLLLSHPIGQRVNGFYYRYTLYPAEAFKSLDQKVLKSCRLQIAEADVQEPVAKALTERDYLPVSASGSGTVPADLDVSQKNQDLVFARHGEAVFTAHIFDFLKNPDTVLETVSTKSDPARFLRTLTFYSLVGISPLLIYVLVHGLCMGALFFIPAWKSRFSMASLASIAMLAGPAIFMTAPLDASIAETELHRYLDSPDWRDRVAALRLISEEDLPVPDMATVAKIAESPMIPERYWAAKTLGNANSRESGKLLRALLDDPHPNVACMALQSLGRQGNVRMIPEILGRLIASDHWYVQWYAYKALKKLGWTQKQCSR